MLISTNSPGSISGTIPIVVDGWCFLVNAFEEALGETILSKGTNRDRVPVYSMARQMDLNKSSSNTFVPCSLDEIRGCGKSTSLGNSSDSGKSAFLNTPDFIDDRHSNQSPLGKSYYMESVAIKICNNFMAEAPSAKYVSYSLEKHRGASMEAQTETIKRREEKVTHTPFFVSQMPGDKMIAELLRMGSGEDGPYILKPTFNLVKSGLGPSAEKGIKSRREAGPAKCPDGIELTKARPRNSKFWRAKTSRMKRSL
ncbi:hypothetical protein Ancab_032496 [Ancistrocladus abbreviatus]